MVKEKLNKKTTLKKIKAWLDEPVVLFPKQREKPSYNVILRFNSAKKKSEFINFLAKHGKLKSKKYWK